MGEALTPLVDAAATDATAGRTDLARARLDFVIAHVVPTARIAIRAQAIRAAMDAHGPVVTTAPSQAVSQLAAPNPLYPTVAPAPGQPQAGYRYAVPTWTPPPPAPPEDPRRRSTGEIIELYVTAGVFGAYTGAWIPYGAGVFNTSSGTDEARALPIAMVLGAGTFVLGVFALDQIDGALRTGQPAALAIGIRYGLGIGALSLGIAGARTSGSTDAAFNVMGFSALGGLAVGAALGFGLEPHPSQVQFVQTVGLWGAMVGAELAAIVAPQVEDGCIPFSPCPAAVETGFGLALGGLGAGIVAGLITSAAGANLSARRSWFMTLGALAGVAVGSGLWGLISYTVNEVDVVAWGTSALLGSVAGLIVVGFLTGDDDRTRTWNDPQVSIAPTVGGAQVILSGAL